MGGRDSSDDRLTVRGVAPAGFEGRVTTSTRAVDPELRVQRAGAGEMPGATSTGMPGSMTATPMLIVLTHRRPEASNATRPNW